MASLDEQLGLLLDVRIAFVVLVLLGALFAPSAVGIDLGQVWPLCAGFMILAGLADMWRRSRWPGAAVVHRALVPADGVFLTVVVAAAGGPRSSFTVLFAVQIVSVVLLAGTISGVATALWDTLLFLLLPTAWLTDRVAGGLGVHHVAAPGVAATVPSIAGFWAVAVFTAVFSSVSQRELRRSKAELAALAMMASALERTVGEEEVLAVLLSSLVGAFPLRRGALWYDDDNHRMGLAVDGPGRPALPCPPPATAEAKDAIVLPLQVDGIDRGLIVLEPGLPSGTRLSRRTVEMLKQFVGHASLALRNARLLAERGRLAAIDGLTGLANRREFDDVLVREVNRAGRTGEPLSLVVFDVDHFKQVNDTRGHLAGDEVLRALSAVMEGAVREMDLVARYGGEEFAVVLPRCDQHDAIRVVERITQTVLLHPVLAGITLSSGVATIPFNAGDGLSLVAAADEALYGSKRAGRNRYSVSARLPSSWAHLPSTG